jgi:hypothetical protein
MKIRFAVPPGALALAAPQPSFRRKLFIDAQASISVPSTC